MSTLTTATDIFQLSKTGSHWHNIGKPDITGGGNM